MTASTNKKQVVYHVVLSSFFNVLGGFERGMSLAEST